MNLAGRFTGAGAGAALDDECPRVDAPGRTRPRLGRLLLRVLFGA